jgi:hypothetical protein
MILSLGISDAVFKETIRSPVLLPYTLTELVTIRVGAVTSFLA